MSYALLGEIAFDLLNAPTKYDERRQANFVQFDVLAGKPQLQAMGVNLRELRLDLRLHYQLGDVESRYQDLMNAKEQQQPLAYVQGESDYQGHFVIEEMSSSTLYTNEQGQAMAREVSLTLKEYVGDVEKPILGEAIQVGKNAPLASVVSRSPMDFMEKKRSLLSRAVQAFHRAKQVIGVIKDAIQIAKTNPANFLAHLPILAMQMGNSLNLLSNTLDGIDIFQGIATGKLETIHQFWQSLSDVRNQIQNIYNAAQGLNLAGITPWIKLSSSAVEIANEIAENAMHATQQVTAWIVLRQDLEQ